MKEGKNSFLVLIGVLFILCIVSPVFSEDLTYNKELFGHLRRACAVIKGETEGALSSETGFIEHGNYLVRSYRILQGDIFLAFFNKKKLPVMSKLSGETFTPPPISFLTGQYGTIYPVFYHDDYSFLLFNIGDDYQPENIVNIEEILMLFLPSYPVLIKTGIVSPYITIQELLGFLSRP
jgi:hypothetical protein